jgi:hypothetical protein
MYGVTMNMLGFLLALFGRSTAISSSFSTLTWFSCFNNLISRSAVIGKPSFSLCIRIFLSATICPVFFDRALETSPNVPSPNFPRYSYSVIREQPWNRRSSVFFGSDIVRAECSVSQCPHQSQECRDLHKCAKRSDLCTLLDDLPVVWAI